VLDGAQYASYGLQIFRRHEPVEQRIAFERSLKRGFAVRGELVVLARWPLLGVGDGLLLSLRADERVALQAAHGRVDRARGQAGVLHDAEAIDVAATDGLQNQGSSMGEGDFGSHRSNLPM
jgi:hypothetical protein